MTKVGGDVKSLLAIPRPATVRTLCLLVIAFGLVLLYVSVYLEQYKQQVCTNHILEGYVRHQLLYPERPQEPPRTDDSATRKNRSSRTRDVSFWDYNWDMKVGEDTKDIQNIPDRTLILVRHGQYDLMTGKLTALGREQAAMTGERLRQANLPFSEIIHSTLDRAVETAQLINSRLTNVPLRPDPMLVEGGPVPPIPTITYWSLPQRDYHIDGPRLESAFRKYFYRGDKSLEQHSYQILVGHGNIFRFFALRALQLPRNAWMRVFIAHASITELHIRADGTIAMTKFGDAGHFPYDKVTY